MTFIADSPRLSFIIDLANVADFFVPSVGVGSKTIPISSSFAHSGSIKQGFVTSVTAICSVVGAVIDYLSKVPGAASAVSFSWTTGPTDLEIDSTVTITLTDYNSALGSTARLVDANIPYLNLLNLIALNY